MASRETRIRPRFCSSLDKITTKGAPAMPYQGLLSSIHSQKGTGSRRWGHRQGSGDAAPGAGDRTAPQKHPSYAGGLAAASQLPPAGHPPRQLPAQERSSRAQTGHRQTDRRAAACCRLLNPGHGGARRGGYCPPASPMGRGFHHPLTQGWDAPVSTLTQPRKRGEMSCLLPFSESRSLYKDEHKQGFHPRPDIALSQGILGL